MYKLNRRITRKLIKTTRKYHKLSKEGERVSAIQYNAREKTLELIRKEIPQKLDAKTVLVKVAYAAITGTDMKILHGQYPLRDGLETVILGHEFVGVVCKDAGEFRIGDRVAVNPTHGCQVCAHCRGKNEHFCPEIDDNFLGISRDGGWQDFCPIPTAQLHKIPGNVSLADAILVHPVSCVRHAWRLLEPVAHGRKILIIGAGLCGNLFAAFCHFNGHRDVTVCEENIKKLNVTVKLNTCFELITPEVLRQRAFKSKQENLFDVIVDCSGHCGMIEMAVDLLNYGGRLCLFGTTSADAQVNISPYQVFRKELDIFAPRLNPYSFPGAFDIIEAMHPRYVSYDKMGMKLFKLDEFREALSCLRQGAITKAVFCLIEPENTQM